LFKNLLKIIYRDLSKDKVYTSISVFGLSAGICVAILIIAINYAYLGYDGFHKKGDRLYQAFYKNSYMESGTNISGTTQYLLGETLKNEYPEIANSATIMMDAGTALSANNIKTEQAGCFSDASVFSMFSFPIIASVKEGEQKVFADRNSIAISRSVAEKYFGSVSNAVGKYLFVVKPDNKTDRLVSSVFEDIPANSSIKFDYVIPIESKVAESPWLINWPWNNYSAATYIEVKPKVDIHKLNNKIKHFLDTKTESNKSELFLYQYDKIYMHPPGGPAKTLNPTLLFIIAGIILCIASINFVNLSASRASRKGKEIGLRKVIGASRRSLVIRFMLETLMLSMIAAALALLFAELLIPYINYSYNSVITIYIPYSNIYFGLSLAGLVVLTTLVSGIYPSVYLSGLMPDAIIKGNTGPQGRSLIRKSLITIQFVSSAIFIFLSVVVYYQMKYITGRDLGVNVKQTLELKLTTGISNHLAAFSNDLKKSPGIEEVSSGGFEPVGIGCASSNFKWAGKPESMNDMVPILSVGDNFLKTFDIKLVKGRDYYPGDSLDGRNCIINEQMEKLIQKYYKGDVIGLDLSVFGNQGKVISVVKDFNSANLYQQMGPVIIEQNVYGHNYCFIKYNPVNVSSVLNSIQKTYNKYEKDYPFSYKFLDEEFLSWHADAKTYVGFFSLFALIAIVISCLGLFGLTAFSIQQKTKEVGIRKVLGASVGSLSFLLTKSYLRMTLFASVTALPAGYYLSGKLLDMFAYKAAIGPEVYIFTVSIITILAGITVIFQVIKAALANPVDSIKYE